jgi:sulfate transport system ATP-binding protein
VLIPLVVTLLGLDADATGGDVLAIVDEGRLEQAGDPMALVDQPDIEFVMTLLGPATQLDGTEVRPHDLVVHRDPEVGSRPGSVERVTHLGFEVNVDILAAGTGAPSPPR